MNVYTLYKNGKSVSNAFSINELTDQLLDLNLDNIHEYTVREFNSEGGYMDYPAIQHLYDAS